MTMPETDPQLLRRLDTIDDRLGRLSTAIIGDEAIGHKGLAGRLEKLEVITAESPNVHTVMKTEIQEAIEGVRVEAREGRAALHKKVDALYDWKNKVTWSAAGIFFGASTGGGFLGSWLWSNLSG
jgi:hypothetical protein